MTAPIRLKGDEASAAAPRPYAGERLTVLDSLRFVAAAAVLFQHLVEQQGPLGERVVGLLSPGVFGVALFFLISGFVIPMSAGRKLDLRVFAIRRILRIYPLVLAAFVGVALCARFTAWPAFDAARGASARDWLLNLLLVQDYTGATPIHGVTWTLSLELVWYALFALLTRWKGRDFHAPLAWAVPLLLLGGAAGSILIHHRIPLARPGMIYAAVIGCRTYAWRAGQVSGQRLALDGTVFAAVMLACNIVSFGYFRHPNITMMQAAVPWLLATGFFFAVMAVPAIRTARLFESRILARLGAVSFSTYLLHPFALAFAEACAPPVLAVPVALIATLLLSLAGYEGVERPALLWARRLTPNRPMALPPEPLAS